MTPLTFVSSAIFPPIQACTLTLVIDKCSRVGVTVRPSVHTFTFLLTIEELPLIIFSVIQEQLPVSMLDIVTPLPFVHIAILIHIPTV